MILRRDWDDESKLVSAYFLRHAEYPQTPPFHPSERYPEYQFREISGEPNAIYAGIRESFRLLDLDTDRFGLPEWNPLGEIVSPGDFVLLKPNFIKEHRTDKHDEWLQIITHGSVIRAVADYVLLALRGRGHLVVADGPQTDSNFDEIVAKVGIAEIQTFYKKNFNINLELYDLRNERWQEKDGIYVDRQPLRGDPFGTRMVDLKHRSLFVSRKTTSKFYGAFYDVDETNHNHLDGRHVYAFCRTPLLANVVIHLPKLKTHKKCGITVNLKGLVGLNGNKNLLPHYAFGSPKSGGDQFENSSSRSAIENLVVGNSKKLLLHKNPWAVALARKLKRHAYGVFGQTSSVVRSGNWHGNDTVWRMALDLYAILTFADEEGVVRDTPQRRFFSVVDGVVAGEGNGPLEATAKECGMIIAGRSLELVDIVCARLMGFDFMKLRLLKGALLSDDTDSEPEKCWSQLVRLVSNQSDVDSELFAKPDRRVFEFEPHFGWKGHVELGI